MPNWVFGYLSVTARTRKPKGLKDAGLTIDKHGKVSDLQTFIKAVQTPKPTFNTGEPEGEREILPFDFEQIIPTPCALYAAEKIYYGDPALKKKQEAEEARLTKLYGYGSAYDFHCGEWDTKWNACDCEVVTDKDGPIEVTKTFHEVIYRFQTAWSPPVAVIKKASKMWPSFRFSYDCEEEANMFDPFTAKFKAGLQTSFKSRKPEDDESDE